VTIKEVAGDAGVSVAAVSKVLRDAYGVSDQLRARVRASMAKLGYRPLAAARGMRGQTYTLGFMIPDLHNPFFADIMAGVNTALERTQYQTLLGVSDSAEPNEKALIEAMIDRQMDGIMVIGPRMPIDEVRDFAARIPTVLVAYHPGGGENFDTVNNDDQRGAELVVQHLIAGGYRQIVYLSQQTHGANLAAMVTTRREAGYRAAMQAGGLARNIRVVEATQTSREIQSVVRHLLESRNRPDAIFCWTDFIGLEVLSVAHDLNLSVPGDLAVVGYDNTWHCDLAQNALTSIDQSGQVLGLQAPRLVARASSAPRA
jgi:LacI family transcriptional regulator